MQSKMRAPTANGAKILITGSGVGGSRSGGSESQGGAGLYTTPLNGARSQRTSSAGPLLSTWVAVAVPDTVPQPL
jgi:hypothetical protein